MNLLKIILLAFAVIILNINLNAQDNESTPEYEATKQTEKLQRELNLSNTQVKQVYEINLKYARARQNSTSRSEAMERMKNKDADLHRVLSNEQINQLQNKRYERSSFQSANPSNFRSQGQTNNSRTTNRPNSNQEYTTQPRRSTSTMQTNRSKTYRDSNQQQRRVVTPSVNNQRGVQTNSTPRSTTPSSNQNTERSRSETSPSSGSQRR